MLSIQIIFFNFAFVAANSIFEQNDFIPIFPYHKKFITQSVPYLTATKSTLATTAASIQTLLLSESTTMTPFIFIMPTQATVPTTSSSPYITIEDTEDLLQECQSWPETPGPKNTYYRDDVEVAYYGPCSTTLCTCQQVKKCNEKASLKTEQCNQSCQSHLSNFGTSIKNYFTCFNDTFEELQQITNCFSNIFTKFTKHENFCSTSHTSTSMKNYAKYLESFAIKDNREDNVKPVDKMVKKARNTFIEIRKFKKCVIKCFMEETIQCYKNLKCDINIPGKNYRDKIYQTCLPLKRQIHKNAVKSCQCLAFKQDVKKLVGTCAHVGNPFLMRNL